MYSLDTSEALKDMLSLFELAALALLRCPRESRAPWQLGLDTAHPSHPFWKHVVLFPFPVSGFLFLLVFDVILKVVSMCCELAIPEGSYFIHVLVSSDPLLQHCSIARLICF
jgi:hypothetical protein